MISFFMVMTVNALCRPRNMSQRMDSLVYHIVLYHIISRLPGSQLLFTTVGVN